MEREERDRHDIENRDMPSTRRTTAILRVRSLTQTASLDPRSWLRHRTTSRPRSVTTATTW
jgi:hypothetical protein